jgi:branched-subunit amino acid ABC-type transport system permease component
MEYLVYATLGLASGAIIAFVALGIVVGYRASGVVNFAQGAIGMYGAYAFVGLRTKGVLFQPIPGLGPGLQIGPKTGLDLVSSILLALLVSLILGFLVHRLVFRPMRGSPPLAQVVASVGVLLVLEALVSVRFGTNPIVAPPVLPKNGTIELNGTFLPNDRVLLVVIVLVISAILWAVYRYTRFGLATRGAAENEKAAMLIGLSPDRLAGISWMVASLIGGLGAILSAQITGLTPQGYTLIVIPALAAALTGRFQSIWITALAALGIGAVQSVLSNLSNDVPWWPPGTPDAVPFILIVIVMFVAGKSLPQRGSAAIGRLPKVPKPGPRLIPSAIAIVVTVVVVLIATDALRSAITVSLIGALVCVSLVVLTGYVGQISLFQLTLSGVAAFLLSYLTTNLGLPFPIAPLVAAMGGAVLGLIAAVPALRVRGINLAIITFAFGFAIDQVVFSNQVISGNFQGLTVVPPVVFGLDLSFISGAQIARVPFVIMSMVIFALCAWAVSNLRRSRTGRRMLAVRSDEQAAAAAGIDVSRTKIIAFIIAGFLAGIAGTLTAYQQSSVSGANFVVLASLALLASAYLGGITSIPGAIVGGTLVAGGLSPFILDFLIFKNIDNGLQVQTVITGVLLIVMAILNPEGIAGAMAKGYRSVMHRIRGRRGGSAPTPTNAEPSAVPAP